MKSVLIQTTPQQLSLYSIKKHEGIDFVLPFHMHVRYELTYIIKGKGTRIIGDSVKEYESGDVILIAPYLAHQWQTEWTDGSKVSAISLFFEDEFPTADFQNLEEFRPIKTVLGLAKRGLELKGELREKIASKLSNIVQTQSLDLVLNILDILNDISRSSQYTILMDGEFTPIKNFDTERITKLVDYIHKNISSQIRLNDIAAIMYMHSGSVNRFFKQSTGFSIVEYINLMRIGKAAKLLSQTDQPILDVAYNCGFQNISHFNRCFKKIKSKTPSQYRNKFLSQK